jgi:hypothetical protein
LNDALRRLAEHERRSLGDHPTPEELVAYRNGELTEPEAEQIRDHLALCHDCADLLLDLADFGHLAPPEGIAPASPEEVDRAWASLQGRIAEAAVPSTPERTAPVVQLHVVSPYAEPSRQDWRTWALAASVILAVGLGAWNLSLQQRVREGLAPRAGGPVVDLKNETTRGADKTAEISAKAGGYLALDPTDQVQGEEYEAEIADDRGSSVYPVLHIFGDEPNIFIQGGTLKPGHYEIRLFAVQGGRRTPAGVFPLQVDAP